MKVSTIVEAILINGALVVVLFWVVGEQAVRASIATSRGLTFTTVRSLFTYVSTLPGVNGQLSSPPTLDWVQVIVVALFLIDLYYIVGARRRRLPAEATSD